MPKVSPGATSKSTSRSAQSSRLGGSRRRRIVSLSERSLTTLSVKIRLTPRARIRPVSISLATSDLNREAALVALDHPEPDKGQQRANDEDVEELRRTYDVALDKHSADSLDVRRDRVEVTHHVNDHWVVGRIRELVEAVEDRRQEEPRQEEH